MKRVRFDRFAVAVDRKGVVIGYQCSEFSIGDYSGDYVPLADAQALEARVKVLERALRVIAEHKSRDPVFVNAIGCMQAVALAALGESTT